MDLHPLAHGFADVADAYERGRPGYPAAAIAAIGLAPGAVVADVGAGTGKLTRALLAAGLEVVAVEPLEGMRARLERELPQVRTIAGTAEALPLEDASVDGVACGDSFHWFDPERAAHELGRVVRPGGAMAILSNQPGAADGMPAWAQQLGAMLAEVRPAHPGIDDDGTTRARFDAVGTFAPLEHHTFPNVHHTDRGGIVASIASMSFVGLLPEGERTDLLQRADALLRDHGVERVDVPLQTELWLARRLGR